MLGAGAHAAPERRVEDFLPAPPQRAAEAFPLVPQRPELAGLQEASAAAASSPDPALKRHAALAGLDARRRATEGATVAAEAARSPKRSLGGEPKAPDQKFALFGLGALPTATGRELPQRRTESGSEGIEGRVPVREAVSRVRATQEPVFEIQLGEAMPVIQAVGLWTRMHRELVMATSAGVLALVWVWARRAERRRSAKQPAESTSHSRGSRRRRHGGHGSRHSSHSRGASSSSSRSRLDAA